MGTIFDRLDDVHQSLQLGGLHVQVGNRSVDGGRPRDQLALVEGVEGTAVAVLHTGHIQGSKASGIRGVLQHGEYLRHVGGVAHGLDLLRSELVVDGEEGRVVLVVAGEVGLEPENVDDVEQVHALTHALEQHGLGLAAVGLVDDAVDVGEVGGAEKGLGGGVVGQHVRVVRADVEQRLVVDAALHRSQQTVVVLAGNEGLPVHLKGQVGQGENAFPDPSVGLD